MDAYSTYMHAYILTSIYTYKQANMHAYLIPEKMIDGAKK